MGKRILYVAPVLMLLASVAWSRATRTVTIKPKPVARTGNAVVLHHIRTIVDHRDKAVYLRLEDVATLMQRPITYRVEDDGTPTGEITIQPAEQARK